MRRLVQIFALLLMVGIAARQGVPQKGGLGVTGPYDVVQNWWKPPHGHHQHVSGVFADSPNRIYVTTTSEVLPPPGVAVNLQDGLIAQPGSLASNDAQHHHFVLVFDATGNITEEWTQWSRLLEVPHKVRVNPYDPDKHVWIVDKGTHQVFKFTRDGKNLVMTLGEKKVKKADNEHFSVPADIAFLPDGSFFVVEEGEDGQPPKKSSVNSRIIRFDKNGKFVLAWETKGKGAGQFDLAHGIAIDSNRRVYVTEENTDRVQIFDENGKFLDEWPNILDPVDVIITRDQFAWVTSGRGNKVAKYNLQGQLLKEWGTYGIFPGGMNRPHQISVDSSGNLYIADSANNRLQKFKPKPDADPKHLVSR